MLPDRSFWMAGNERQPRQVISWLHLNRIGKMISGIQSYENGVPNIIQNGGNYAIFKQVLLQPSLLWSENVGKIYSTWIFGIKKEI
jgi:hypothetical protein